MAFDAISTTVRIGADAAALIAESARADRALAQLERQASSLRRSLVAGVTVGGLLAFAEHVIDTTANLKDFSERTGASVEQLSIMQRVAQETGHAFEPAIDAIDKYARIVGSGGEVTKRAEQAAANLGISIRDQTGRLKDGATVFREAAIAQTQYADGIEKAQNFQALFSKSAAELLPYMNDLAERGNRQALVTREQAERMDALQKSLKTSAASFQDFGRAILYEVEPAITAFAKAMGDLRTEVFDTTKSAGASQLQSWAFSVATAFAYVIDSVVFIVKLLRTLAGSFEVVYADIRVIGQAVITLGKIWSKDAREQFKKELDARNAILAEANARYVDLWNYEGDATVKAVERSIAAVKEEQKGLMGPPDDRPRRRLSGITTDDKESKKLEEAYQRIKQQIDERTAALRAEAGATGELTENQKFLVKVLTDLGQGYIDLTPQREAAIRDMLAELGVMDAEAEAFKAFDKATKEYLETRDKQKKQADELVDRYRFEVESVGLTGDALAKLTAERELQRIGISQLSTDYDAYLSKLTDWAKLKEAADQHKKTFDTIDRAANEAWLDIFDGAQDMATRLQNTLKRGLLQLLYELTIKKWLITIDAQLVGNAGQGILTNFFRWALGGAGGGGFSDWGTEGSGQYPGSDDFDGGGWAPGEQPGTSRAGRSSWAAAAAAIASGPVASSGGARMAPVYAPTYYIDSRSDRAEIVALIENGDRSTFTKVGESGRRGGSLSRIF